VIVALLGQEFETCAAELSTASVHDLLAEQLGVVVQLLTALEDKGRERHGLVSAARP